MKQLISVLVENQSGVLSKISGLFARRGFNIDSLAVGVTEDKTVSRITMLADSGNSVAEQMEKQLNKLVPVIKVRTFEENEVVSKELALIKVSATNKNRGEIRDIVDMMHTRIIDMSTSTVTIEICDSPEKIDILQDMMRPFGIKEVARTGVVSLQKGSLNI
ncbi:MAG: acetolactate synthase small subunit [Clostridia bacterium]|nr:acetolactate synthase small subunit [Clostridia bacterium]